MTAAKSFCEPRNPEKFFLSGPTTSPKALTNPVLLTRNSFQSGAAWNGGALQTRLAPRAKAKLNPQLHPLGQGWNFLSARVTLKIPARNGRAGLAPMPSPEHAPNVPPRGSYNGKR